MPQTVLIVDDDELTVRLLETRLQEKGCETITAMTGDEAIKLVVERSPSVVIMDIMLPDMQGSDAVRIFQENSDTSDKIKIIFLSGIISQKDDNEGKILVGNKFYPAVSKPINFDLLMELIQK